MARNELGVDETIWKQRWQAHRKIISEMVKSLNANKRQSGQLSMIDDQAKQAVESLLIRLESFADYRIEDYIQKLKGALGDNPMDSNNASKVPNGYSIQYALHKTLLNVGRDLEVISNAAFSRVVKGAGPEIAETLQLADYMAIEALKPAAHLIASEGDPKVQALTYLNKRPLIRVIPYAPVALIGVPISSLNVNYDLFAIPHEVGHYIYWNGKTKDSSSSFFYAVPEALRDFPVWIQKWGEEIFADVYGAIIAGPTIGVIFQNMQVDGNTQDEFLQDDADHPTPILRPFVYSAVLRQIEQYKEWAEILDEDWNAHLERRELDRASFTPSNFNGLILNKNPRELLVEATVAVFKLVEAQFSKIPPDTKWAVWTKADPNRDREQGYESLLIEWDKKINDLKKPDGTRYVGRKKDMAAVPRTDKELRHEWKKANDALALEALTQPDESAQHKPSPQERRWLAEFSAGGWSDGPGNPPATGG
jgi:hypothetical protein